MTQKALGLPQSELQRDSQYAQDWGLLEDSTQKAATLALQYQSAFITERGVHASNLTFSLGLSKLHLLRVIRSDELSVITRIKTGPSYGPNELNPKLFRVLKPVIAGHISEIFNKPLETEVLPEE